MDVKRVNIMRIYIIIVFSDVLAVTLGHSQLRGLDDAYTRFRRKRRVNCAEKFATITYGHSACLQRSPSAQDSGVSKQDQQKIVEEHNRQRKDVYPPAKNMREMSWDDGLADIAQRWADNCRIGHDQRYKRYDYGRFDVGQNLCWSTYKMSWDEAMGLWSNETKDYQYGSSYGVSAVAHYTQIIWAETALVGCGYTLCRGTHFYVCNYGPAGNFDISKPYEAGQSCADCPYTCRDKLCDCRGKVCLNGGKMDLKTCTCTCNKEFNFYMQPYCELNCTDIKDPAYCSQQFGPATCEIYSNVPQMCPDMCKWCPAAGKRHDKTVYDTKPRDTSRKKEDTEDIIKQREETRRHEETRRREETVARTQQRNARRRNEGKVSVTQTQDEQRRTEETVSVAKQDDTERRYKGRVFGTANRNAGRRYENTITGNTHRNTERRYENRESDITHSDPQRRYEDNRHRDTRRRYEDTVVGNHHQDTGRRYEDRAVDNHHRDTGRWYEDTASGNRHRDTGRNYDDTVYGTRHRDAGRRYNGTRSRNEDSRPGTGHTDLGKQCEDLKSRNTPTTEGIKCECAKSICAIHVGFSLIPLIFLSLTLILVLI